MWPEWTRINWLGREDSNLRMVESKSTALPLGDAPKTMAEWAGWQCLPLWSGQRRSIETIQPFQQGRRHYSRQIPSPVFLRRNAAFRPRQCRGRPFRRELRDLRFRGKTATHPAPPKGEITAMTYRAPISDILLALNHGAGLKAAVELGHYGDFDADITTAVLEEAGKFASDVLTPLNRVGDQHGVKLEGGKVITAPGWPDAYKRWTEAGWNAVSGPEAFGGQGLPLVINAACTEIWSASNVAFGLCPLLTLSAIEALDAHGTEELKKIYLAKLVSGEWTGTMQLTEPQAGSDVGALRTRAERQADGTYSIKGTKIFITYGDHDMTDNIVHFVLARLPDAPAGTKGISLFLIPKFMVNEDGSLGSRNDIYASGVEHKLGMHASPTCTMTMGDDGGAIGYLIGEENRGMLCMFTMMNQARLGVGLEGVGIADRAYQQALAFAQERKQGRAVGKKSDGLDPIIVHPDVKRMLLQMRSMTAAARSICYATAVALDIAVRASDPKVRADAAARGALLTPI